MPPPDERAGRLRGSAQIAQPTHPAICIPQLTGSFAACRSMVAGKNFVSCEPKYPCCAATTHAYRVPRCLFRDDSGDAAVEGRRRRPEPAPTLEWAACERGATTTENRANTQPVRFCTSFD